MWFRPRQSLGWASSGWRVGWCKTLSVEGGRQLGPISNSCGLVLESTAYPCDKSSHPLLPLLRSVEVTGRACPLLSLLGPPAEASSSPDLPLPLPLTCPVCRSPISRLAYAAVTSRMDRNIPVTKPWIDTQVRDETHRRRGVGGSWLDSQGLLPERHLVAVTRRDCSATGEIMLVYVREAPARNFRPAILMEDWSSRLGMCMIKLIRRRSLSVSVTAGGLPL